MRNGARESQQTERRALDFENRVLFNKIEKIKNLLQVNPYSLNINQQQELENALIEEIHFRDPLLGLENHLNKYPNTQELFALNIIEPSIRDLNKQFGISGADEIMAKAKSICQQKLNAAIWNQSASGFRFSCPNQNENSIRQNISYINELTFEYNGRDFAIKIAVGSVTINKSQEPNDNPDQKFIHLKELSDIVYKLDIATNIAKKRQRSNTTPDSNLDNRQIQKYEANFAILDSLQSFSKLYQYIFNQRETVHSYGTNPTEINFAAVLNTFLFDDTLCTISPEVITLIRKGLPFSKSPLINSIARSLKIHKKKVESIVDNNEFRKIVTETISTINYFDHIRPTTLNTEDEKYYLQNCIAIRDRINNKDNDPIKSAERIETLQYFLRQSNKSTFKTPQSDKSAFFNDQLDSDNNKLIAMLDIVGLGQRNISNLQTTLLKTFLEIANKINELHSKQNLSEIQQQLVSTYQNYKTIFKNAYSNIAANKDYEIYAITYAINEVLTNNNNQNTRQELLKFITEIDSYPSFEDNILKSLDEETTKIHEIIKKIENLIYELTGIKHQLTIATGGDEIYIAIDPDTIVENKPDTIAKYKRINTHPQYKIRHQITREFFNQAIKTVMQNEPVRGGTTEFIAPKDKDPKSHIRQIIQNLIAIETAIEKLKANGEAFTN